MSPCISASYWRHQSLKTPSTTADAVGDCGAVLFLLALLLHCGVQLAGKALPLLLILLLLGGTQLAGPAMAQHDAVQLLLNLTCITCIIAMTSLCRCTGQFSVGLRSGALLKHQAQRHDHCCHDHPQASARHQSNLCLDRHTKHNIKH